MKKIGFLVMALCLTLAFGTSCKSKQSAYKAAYEQAKAREMAEPADNNVIAPVNKPIATSETRQERITPVAGEDGSVIRLYSVVIGSFRNKTNAFSLKERMQNEGYMPVLAENDQGMLRVILTSYDNRADAERSRDAIRSKYYPNYQDAWILQRSY
ncbi:MAG: SPOR domain-containing protein [Tannerella sp.]|jgi:cell division protein FtsN|nr:SPOR domain-containing protein [Tannerella sp.]